MSYIIIINNKCPQIIFITFTFTFVFSCGTISAHAACPPRPFAGGFAIPLNCSTPTPTQHTASSYTAAYTASTTVAIQCIHTRHCAIIRYTSYNTPHHGNHCSTMHMIHTAYIIIVMISIIKY